MGVLRDWLEGQLEKLVLASWTTGPNGPDADRRKLENHCRRGRNDRPAKWILDAMERRQVIRIAVDLQPAGPELALVLFTNRRELDSKTFLIRSDGCATNTKRALVECLVIIRNQCGAILQISDESRFCQADASYDSPRRNMRE